MKKLFLAVILVSLLPSIVHAQAAAGQGERLVPDCEFAFRFAVVGGVITAPIRVPVQAAQVGPVAQVTVGYDNRYTNCTSWTMVYHTDGVTSPSIELDEAPTSAGNPGSWSTWPASSVAPGSTLPLTTANFSQVSTFTYFPWISVILNSASGSGQVEGHVYGWRPEAANDASTTGITVISRFNPATAQSSASSQQTPETASSGTQAATTATCTLAASAGKTTYITGFQITGAGATGASVIAPTVTGVITGTMTYELAIPAGVTAPVTPLVVSFPIPVPASAVNTTIVVSAPSFGAGNTNASCVAQGFQSN